MVEVACVTSEYITLTGVCVATPTGVSAGHWGAANPWAGPGEESIVQAAAGPGLAGTDGAGPGVAGTVVAGPGGSVVNYKEIRSGTGLWEAGVLRDGPRAITGAMDSILLGRSGTKTNSGARSYRVTFA